MQITTRVLTHRAQTEQPDDAPDLVIAGPSMRPVSRPDPVSQPAADTVVLTHAPPDLSSTPVDSRVPPGPQDILEKPIDKEVTPP